MATPRDMPVRLWARIARLGPGRFSDQLQRDDEVVREREAEQKGVETVEHAAVTRQQGAEVLQAEVALDHGLAQVAEECPARDQQAEQKAAVVLIPRRDVADYNPTDQQRRDH